MTPRTGGSADLSTSVEMSAEGLKSGISFGESTK